MERAVLTKKALRNFFIIDKPGTTTLPCSATTRLEHRIVTPNSIYYNVYLRAITKHNFNIVLSILDEHPIISFTDVSNYFLNGVIFQSQLKEGYKLPTKGEKVIVTFYINDLGYFKVNSIELIPRTFYHRISDEEILPLIQTFKNYYNGNKSNNRPDLS